MCNPQMFFEVSKRSTIADANFGPFLETLIPVSLPAVTPSTMSSQQQRAADAAKQTGEKARPSRARAARSEEAALSLFVGIIDAP
jgi:hypothetical protein